MAGKNAKKATSTSSKIPPNKLPEIITLLLLLLLFYNQNWNTHVSTTSSTSHHKSTATHPAIHRDPPHINPQPQITTGTLTNILIAQKITTHNRRPTTPKNW
jgi:hypothetical protein